MLIFEFATSFLPWDAVMCAVYCTPKKDWGIPSLTTTAREINNQVSLLPLPFPILGLIKNSSVKHSSCQGLRDSWKTCASVLLAQA